MIAFFYMLIGLLGLLDAGIGGAFIKLIATNRDHEVNYRKVVLLYKKFLFFFFLVACALFGFFYFNHEYIVRDWLNTSVDHDEAIYSVKSMGFVLAFFYIKSYLVSFLNGMERQELSAIWAGVYGTFFYLGSFLALENIEGNLFSFFYWMQLVAVLDLFVILCLVVFVCVGQFRILSHHVRGEDINPVANCSEEIVLSKVLRFSLQLSGLSIIWVIATQIDKFVLSAYIPLGEYGKYQIAVQLSSAVAIFSVPVTQLLLPRLSNLFTQAQSGSYIYLYANSILIFSMLVAPLSLYFFYFGSDLLNLWLGEIQLAKEVNSYAKWLVSAAFFAAMMNFVFICLYSIGQLKTHFYVYAFYSVLTIPTSIFVASEYGATGSSKFIFLHTFVFMLMWGGFQFYVRFKNFLKLFSFSIALIILVSFVNFGLLSAALNFDGAGYIRAILPPIVNLLILFLLFIGFRKVIKKSIDEVVFLPFASIM